LGGMWEILESWITRIAHPELGLAYLGAQGDIWDAQKDMAATLYGALASLVIIVCARKLTGTRFTITRERPVELTHASNQCGERHQSETV
jgi:putative membrane protein